MYLVCKSSEWTDKDTREMRFLPQTLTRGVSIYNAQCKRLALRLSVCVFLCPLLPPAGQTENYLAESKKEHPTSPSTVTHVNMDAFFPQMSHIHLALKRKIQEWKIHVCGHRCCTSSPACFDFICEHLWMIVWGTVDRSDRGLIFYSWKWCPHPAISVTQSPSVSITGFGGGKKPKGGYFFFKKRMYFMLGVAGRLACQ